MTIKRYTCTMSDTNKGTGKFTFNAEDDGNHTDALAIVAAIQLASNGGLVSLKASESVAVTTTEPTVPGSKSVRKRVIIQYVVKVGVQTSSLRISIPDSDDTIVSAGDDILKNVSDPLSIYDKLRTEEGHTPIQVISWAKYDYKRPKTK